MSKRLEDEYRQMVNEQVPDLWNRIEAGLKEKNSPPVTVTETKKNTKKKVIFRILPWAGGVVAAAVIFILVVPALLSMTGKQKSATYTAENAVSPVPAGGAKPAETDTVEMAEAVMPDAAAGESAEEETFNQVTGNDDRSKQTTGEVLQFKGSQKLQAVPQSEDGGEENLYVKVFAFDTDTESGQEETILTVFVGTDLKEVIKESGNDGNSLVEAELSVNSPLKPEKGKTYRIEADQSGILLLEEASADSE